jgi:hypothetical protein
LELLFPDGITSKCTTALFPFEHHSKSIFERIKMEKPIVEKTSKGIAISYVKDGDVAYCILEPSRNPELLSMVTGYGALLNHIFVHSNLNEIEQLLNKSVKSDPQLSPIQFRKIVKQNFDCVRPGYAIPLYQSMINSTSRMPS